MKLALLSKRICLTLLLTLSLLSGQGLNAATSVTLGWDEHPDPKVTGYKLYVGEASRRYGSGIDVGNVNQYRVTGLLNGKTYYFAATAYNAEAESKFSKELVYNTGDPILEPLPNPACCGEIIKLAIIEIVIEIEAETAGLSASVQTGIDASGVKYVFSPISDRGYIVFNFSLAEAGNYLIEARINSRNNNGQDSFYVGFVPEAEIRNNHNVYDTSLVGDFTWDEVSLRGPTGTFDRADYDPRIWQLTAGSQRLVFAVRESNTWLDKIRIRKPVPSNLRGSND